LLALLAALGIGTSQFRSQSPTPPAPPPKRTVSAPKTTEQGFYEHSAVDLLDEFLGTSLPPVRSDKPWSKRDQPPATPAKSNQPIVPLHKKKSCRHVVTPDKKKIDPTVGYGESDAKVPSEDYRVDFLIAMLPEPASPPLRYQFDAELRAIQIATSQADYTLATFDLPWMDEAKDETHEFRLGEEVDLSTSEKPGSVLNGSSLSIKPNTEDENRSERDPGIILFVRHNPTTRGTDLLVTFIVGDTPTRGVNKTALRDALDQIAWLRGLRSGAPPRYLGRISRYSKTSGTPEFKIVGPAFSGSAESLRNTLEEWESSFEEPGPRVPVHIVSGAATAISDELDGVAAYESVRLPDKQVEAQILDDLLRGSPDLEPIYQVRPPDSSAQLPPPIAILSDSTSYGVQTGNTHLVRYLVQMNFPLHISDLRNVYGVVPRQAGSSPALSHSNLPFPNESDREERDVAPSFSDRAAVYDELALEELLTNLKRRQIRYVGIKATDVEDLIFLAQRIREYCPNTVVFTFSNDLRFLHSDVNQDLEGMLVFSTYPLFAFNQFWTYPFDGAKFEFFNEDAEGVFNATLKQLGKREEMVEYGEPFTAKPEWPALWVSAVGRHDIWPLAYHAFAGGKARVGEAPTTPDHVVPAEVTLCGPPAKPRAIPITLALYPPSSLVAALIVVFGCLVAAIPKLRATSDSGRSWLGMLLQDAVLPEFHRERQLRMATLFVGGILPTYLIALVYFLLPLRVALQACLAQNPRPPLSLDWSIWGSWGFVLVAALMLLLGCLMLLVGGGFVLKIAIEKWRSIGHQNGGREPKFSWVVLGLSVLALGFSVWFIGTLWSSDCAIALFTFFRAVDLGDGLSPLRPLIFLAIAFLALATCDLWRLSVLEECYLPEPFQGFNEAASFKGIKTLAANVSDVLKQSPMKLPWAWAICLLWFGAFSGFLVTSWNSFIVDGRAFELFFFLVAFTIYLLFSLYGLRFLCTWTALHRLLRRLYWHQTGAAYETLRIKSWPTAQTRKGSGCSSRCRA